MAEEKNINQEPKKKFEKVKDKLSKSKKPQNSFNLYWLYAIVIFIFITFSFFDFGGTTKPVSLQKFKEEMLLKGDVEKIIIVSNEQSAEIYIKSERLEKPQYKDVSKKAFGNSPNPGPHYKVQIGTDVAFSNMLNEVQKELPEDQKVLIDKYENHKNWGADLLGILLPIILIVAVWMFFMRRMSGPGGPGGQIFNFGKSKATLFDQNMQLNITFADVAGLEGAKEEVMEIVDFLKNPIKYTSLGAKIPKGALLVGPPGTGKTLLAKAVAGEAKVPFFSLSGSDFVEMFVGVGASRVRDLFKQAKEKAPCIIFIDEIDAIGRARGKNPMQGANDERENTLNQLLTEMDGFGTNSGIIILAATNRADILDSALLRAGRFDRQIYVDMPDLNERKEIFQVHIKPLKLDKSVDIDFLSKQTPGFSGADIANLCNEAALIAARKTHEAITKQDFLDAVDRLIAGLEKKNKIITPEEKKVIAFHEAGHATISWLLEHASPLVKVTIVPRGKSLGAAWYLPEERQITTTEQLFDEMCAALGGRAAEEIVFNKISTGALSDLEKITKQAYAMVAIYGLNEKIGNRSYYDSQGQDYSFTKPYSEKTAELIDEEVNLLIQKAYERTKQILLENKDKLTLLAEALLKKEVIFKEDLEDIFGKSHFEKEDRVLVTKDDQEKSEPIPAQTPTEENISEEQKSTHIAAVEPEERENTTNQNL